MEARGIRTLQIASSAEVYGAAPQSVFSENLPRRPVSKAGMYHHLVENMLEALRHSNPSWRVAVLRHFNPSGAHPSGLLGQRGPFMGQPAVLTQLARASSSPVEPLQVCAHQHPTPDGSPVLDLTHVQDIAEAHVAALEAQLDYDEGFSVNVGTGQGHSVLDLIHAFEVGNACKVTWQFAPHRTSGTTRQVANTELALQLMGWRAQHTLTEVCVDAMRWHQTLLREREAVRR
jgi:UDP-glucose 4-epimerase